jgi:S-(hydroxymethyl)glutathione dehydrogenase/alcohol dehydrogenase
MMEYIHLAGRHLMKAAILYKFGEPLVIEDVNIDPPRRGEIKVRIAACGVCHSDIHSFKGEHGNPPLPAIGGHEVAGIVEEIGEGVNYVKPGDHVAVGIAPAGCGHCYYCSIGLSNMCTTNHLYLAAPGKMVTQKGKRCTQLAGAVAGYCEYTVLPEVNVVKIPDDMPFDRAGLLACGVISGWGAVVNRAQVKPNSSVLVVGCGGVGLNAIQGALYSGAYPIIAYDVMDSKLEAAKTFGASHTINAKKEADPLKKVRELTYGRGADYVFQAVAGIDILRQAFMMSAMDGMTVVIGHGFGEKLTAFTPTDFMSGKRLTGSAMGATRLRLDIPRLIELYYAKRLKLDELISGHYPLERINEAVDSMLKGNVIRNIITFD